MQVHWLLDNVQNARQWMLHNGADRYSHFTGVRNSWTKLIEDLGLQYEFVGRGHLEQGSWAQANTAVLIMPQSLAMSAAEASGNPPFSCGEGLLIADYRAASMNEHGRDLGKGQLAMSFGIQRVRANSEDKLPTAAPTGSRFNSVGNNFTLPWVTKRSASLAARHLRRAERCRL